MTQRLKWLVLTLLLVGGVLLVQGLVNEPEPQPVALQFTSGHTQSREAAWGTSGLPALIHHRAEPITFKTPRNIFAPLSWPEKKPEQQRTRIAKKPEPAPTAPPPLTPEELARLQQELAAKQARHLMGQYRFLGYLIRAGEQQAFLEKGRNIYIVRPGETLDALIQIQAIDGSSVKLKHHPTSVETTLLLKENGSGGDVRASL